MYIQIYLYYISASNFCHKSSGNDGRLLELGQMLPVALFDYEIDSLPTSASSSPTVAGSLSLSLSLSTIIPVHSCLWDRLSAVQAEMDRALSLANLSQGDG